MAAQFNDGDPTKERLLIEAERLFAEKGFDAVSVREITAAAETNTAAVNYHFSSKRNLYIEVFRQRWIPRATKNFYIIKDLDEDPNITVKKAIIGFIRCFMDGPFSDHTERTTHYRLIHKELDFPTEAYEIVLTEVIAPFYEVMIRVIQRAIPGIQREEALFKCMSIFGQMVYFSHAQPIIEIMMGTNFMDQLPENLVNHIVTFSIRGFEANGDQP